MVTDPSSEAAAAQARAGRERSRLTPSLLLSAALHLALAAVLLAVPGAPPPHEERVRIELAPEAPPPPPAPPEPPRVEPAPEAPAPTAPAPSRRRTAGPR